MPDLCYGRFKDVIGWTPMRPVPTACGRASDVTGVTYHPTKVTCDQCRATLQFKKGLARVRFWRADMAAGKEEAIQRKRDRRLARLGEAGEFEGLVELEEE